MNLGETNEFLDLSMEESLETEGGVLGTIAAIAGIASGVVAIGTGIYAYGYAKGQQAAYRELEKRRNKVY